MKFNDIKKEFPLFENVEIAYLDNSATSQKPISVINAEKEYYEKYNANPMRGLYPLSVLATELYESAREKVRKFISAKYTEEIVFLKNTTEGINLVAYSYGMNFIKKDDEIVVSVMEHHSNMLPWQMVAEKTGAKISYLMCEDDGSLSDKEIERAFSSKTKLVAINHISNVLGRVNPISKIVKKAKESNAVVVLDIAQSVPHIPVNVQELDVDFAVFSGHKMYASMGIGVLYAKKELLEKMPPFLTGGEMIESVTLNGATYAEIPHKFEAGTVNVGGAVSLSTAIDFIEKIGFDFIKEREDFLTEKLMKELKNIPHVKIIGSNKAEEHLGIVCFSIEDVHPHDVSEILSSDGIAVRAGHHCAQPLLAHLGVRSVTRASIMLYNSEDDIERLVKSIASVRRRMGFGE